MNADVATQDLVTPGQPCTVVDRLLAFRRFRPLHRAAALAQNPGVALPRHQTVPKRRLAFRYKSERIAKQGRSYSLSPIATRCIGRSTHYELIFTRASAGSPTTSRHLAQSRETLEMRQGNGCTVPMDEIALAFYELKFQVAFMTQRGEAYQGFFSSIMEKRYPADFFRVRPWGNVGDRKNDGYLRSRRILFQSYAPNEMSASKCSSKIQEDFFESLPYWRAHFDTWVFVHNSMDGLGPDVTKLLLDLGVSHSPLKVVQWGFEELRQEAMSLAHSELASLLGPAPTRLGMMSLGLENLAPVLDQVALLAPTSDPDLRPVPADKLQRNMLSPSVETLLRAGMSRADLVRKYFSSKPTLQDQIAESFRARYMHLRSTHSPDNLFAELQRYAGGSLVRDPSAQSAILAVLAFFFEECDIFERV